MKLGFAAGWSKSFEGTGIKQPKYPRFKAKEDHLKLIFGVDSRIKYGRLSKVELSFGL